MAYLRRTFFAEYDGDDIESQGFVFYIVGTGKILRRKNHSFTFTRRNRFLSLLKNLASPRFYLDENYRRAGGGRVAHHKIDLATPTRVIARNKFESFFLEEFFAAPFAPSPQLFGISEQPLSGTRQQEHRLGTIC